MIYKLNYLISQIFLLLQIRGLQTFLSEGHIK